MALINTLSNAADDLKLQIIATTHSPSLVEYLHQESRLRGNNQKRKDKVIYLADSQYPGPVDWPLNDVINDMKMVPLKKTKIDIPEPIKIYLEDDQAACFFMEIMGMKNSVKTLQGTGIKFKVIPIGVGGDSILGLPKYDSYFKKVLLLVDGDKDPSLKNALKLPSDSGSNPERTLYNYISALKENGPNTYPETFKLLRKRRITTDRLVPLVNNVSLEEMSRKKWKTWFNKNKQLILDYKLISLWAKDHDTEMNEFIKALSSKLTLISEVAKSNV